MGDTIQKVTIQLIKLGVAVALSQLANQSVRDIGSSALGEISKGIRRVKTAYQERREAA